MKSVNWTKHYIKIRIASIAFYNPHYYSVSKVSLRYSLATGTNVNYGRYKLTVSRVTNSSMELLGWKLHVLVIDRTLKQYFKSFTQPSWYLPEQTILAKCRPARWNGTWYMQKTYPYCFLGYLLLLVLTCRQKGPFGAGSPYLQAVAFSYWAL